jgi:3-oxoacyl-[acyl-carrier-protein] synthase-3
MTEMGIVSTGTWFPDTYVSAQEIAEQSGLPEWVVREKLGIERKFVADPNVHPNEMAVNAARKAVERAGIDPMDIDVVLSTTEEWREYLLWTTAIDIAQELGAKNAWGLDIHARCVTTIAALKLARSLMADDPNINTVLIAGGYAISHFIDLTDVNTSFLFNIGAGAGAMIVKRDWPENRVKGIHLIADGTMSRHVIVPASGTVRHPTDAAMAQGDFKFRLVEPEAMKERLGEVSINNWLECVDKALANSGEKADGMPYTRADIDFFNMSLVSPRRIGRCSRTLACPRSRVSIFRISATSGSRTPSSTSRSASSAVASSLGIPWPSLLPGLATSGVAPSSNGGASNDTSVSNRCRLAG